MDLVSFAALGVLGKTSPLSPGWCNLAAIVHPATVPGLGVGQGVLDRWAAPRIPSATRYLLAWRSVEQETRLELATFCLESI